MVREAVSSQTRERDSAVKSICGLVWFLKN
jgi:hypothetical protein